MSDLPIPGVRFSWHRNANADQERCVALMDAEDEASRCLMRAGHEAHGVLAHRSDLSHHRYRWVDEAGGENVLASIAGLFQSDEGQR